VPSGAVADLLEIRVSPGAAADLDQIYEPVFSEVVERLALLRSFPEMGVPMPGRFVGWRCTTVRMFRVIYRITRRGIEVAYVRHCKRRPVKS